MKTVRDSCKLPPLIERPLVERLAAGRFRDAAFAKHV